MYASTTFDEVKDAACMFWGRVPATHEITDEYFNNLLTFKGTVCDFYNGNYVPLNRDRHAIVYLFVADLKQLRINEL